MTTAEKPVKLTFRKGKDRRVRQGHPWVFSNEIQAWPKGLAPGGVVDVHDPKGKFLGRGYANKGSLISVRLLTRKKKEAVDGHLIRDLLDRAITDREVWMDDTTDACRLVNGEGDGLPGLVVDRYADVLAVQILTQGMERFREVILAHLEDRLAPRAIVDRRDNRGRALEELDTKKCVVRGEAPADPVAIRQDGMTFLVDVLDGQKTGFFLDQRAHRQRLLGLVKDRDVLDTFCYTGASAVYALRGGARSVTGIDSSRPALELAEKTMLANGLPECSWIQSDGFEGLKQLAEQGRTFGCVLLDPPPFAPSKKNRDKAMVAHLRLHKLALRVLEPGGWLVSSTCSHHVSGDDLGTTAAQAAVQAGRTIRLMARGGAFADHPSVPGMPEGEYLSTLYMKA